jgi:hypothetical protein
MRFATHKPEIDRIRVVAGKGINILPMVNRDGLACAQ